MKRFCYVIIMLSVLFTACKENKGMQKLVFINSKGESVNLTTDPYGITEWEGFSNTDLNLQTQQVPLHDGSVYLDGLLSERDLSVTLAINAKKDFEKRYRLRRELIEILNPKLGEGELIYTNDYTTKRIKCVPNMPVFENCNSNDSGTPKASLSWTACDPYWEDLEETTVELTSGKRFEVVNNGDVPTTIKAVMKTNKALNPVLHNFTEDKKILLLTDINQQYVINTGFGEKAIYSTKNKLSKIKGFGTINDMVYSRNYGYYILSSEDVWCLKSDDLTNFEFFDTEFTLSKPSLFYSKLKRFFLMGCDSSGYGGKILYSEEGVKWIPTNGDWNYMGFAENSTTGKIIAVGGYLINTEQGNKRRGCFAVSSDGKNWSENTLTNTNNVNNYIINDITNSDSLFVIVGNTGYIYSSPDGETWTFRGISGGDLFGVCYGNGMFVAVGSSGAIYTSTNGTTWTSRTSGISTQLNKVCYWEKDNCFYACGSSGKLIKSSDGISWSNVSTGTSKDLKRVKVDFDGNLVIMGTNVLAVSSDGVNWIYKQGVTTNYNGCAFSKELNLSVVVGNNGLIMTSPDGLEWTYRPTSIPSYSSIKSVAWSSYLHKFLAVGNNKLAFYSSDGINWTECDSSSVTTNRNWNKVISTEDDKGFVLVGDNGGFATSADGEVITRLDNTGSSSYFSSVCYDGEKIIIPVMMSVLYSYDFTNWNTASLGMLLNPTDIIYIEDMHKYLIIDSFGRYAVSSDGINWENKILDSSMELTGEGVQSVCYVKEWGLCIITGDKNYFYFSTNLIDWTTLSVLTYAYAEGDMNNCVVDIGNRALVVGENGTVEILSKELYENIVNLLSSDSDMSLSLQKGSNSLLVDEAYNGNIRAVITYRQKYVGV